MILPNGFSILSKFIKKGSEHRQNQSFKKVGIQKAPRRIQKTKQIQNKTYKPINIQEKHRENVQDNRQIQEVESKT